MIPPATGDRLRVPPGTRSATTTEPRPASVATPSAEGVVRRQHHREADEQRDRRGSLPWLWLSGISSSTITPVAPAAKASPGDPPSTSPPSHDRAPEPAWARSSRRPPPSSRLARIERSVVSTEPKPCAVLMPRRLSRLRCRRECGGDFHRRSRWPAAPRPEPMNEERAVGARATRGRGVGAAYPEHREADVALRDGSTVHVRPVRSGDREPLQTFFEGLSERPAASASSPAGPI